jgi:hypothetical protein
MHVGNRHNTPFWEVKWLHGAAPKDFAPGLFRRTRFKNRSVAIELRNKNWIRSLKEIPSADLLQEFVMLHLALSSIQLTDQPDEVIWRWTADEKFTVADSQFIGAYTFFPAMDVWKAFNEPKCRLFA